MAQSIDMPTGLRPPRKLAQLGELSLPLDLVRFGLQWPGDRAARRRAAGLSHPRLWRQ